MSFPNPDNYARDCDCGTAGANTTPPPATLVAQAVEQTKAAVLTNPFLLPNGGTITTLNTTTNTGGSINTSAGSGGNGGGINTQGSANYRGGLINTSASQFGNGGDIDTSNWGGKIDTHDEGGNIDTHNVGGDINTSNEGGYINTSNDGGYINTSSDGGSIYTGGPQGFIQLGVSETRTTLYGHATAPRTLTLPNITGTIPIALISQLFTISSGQNFATNAYTDFNFTVTGASFNDVVFVTCVDRSQSSSATKLIFVGFVPTADTVTVRVHNPGAGAISNGSAMYVRIAILKTA